MEYNLYSWEAKKVSLRFNKSPKLKMSFAFFYFFFQASNKQEIASPLFFFCTDNCEKRVSCETQEAIQSCFLTCKPFATNGRKNEWKAPQSAIKNLMILLNRNCLKIQYTWILYLCVYLFNCSTLEVNNKRQFNSRHNKLKLIRIVMLNSSQKLKEME